MAADDNLPGYGAGTTDPSVAASGSDFAAAGSQVFTWTKMQQCTLIHNRANSGVNLFVLWSGTVASTTEYDVCLAPGQSIVSPSGINVTQVAIYADAGVAYKTGFSVRGWK